MMNNGDKIDQFRLLSLLGRGGMGEVWLAVHEEKGIKVALKIPTDPDYIKQLRREGKLQMALDHPNIVKVYGIKLDGEPPYAVMEYIEGRSLRTDMKEKGSYPATDAIQIIEQVLNGLEAAHRKGVIQRDLKPENILLDMNGRVKITDFGLGKVQESLSKSLLFTGSMLSSAGHSIAGTYDYMAPEQKEGVETSAAVDIYALGLIFFEMLTGNRPSGSLRRVLQRRGIDESLIDLIVRATDQLTNRYQSVTELREDLNRVTQGLPIPRRMEEPAIKTKPAPKPPVEEPRRMPSEEDEWSKIMDKGGMESKTTGDIFPTDERPYADAFSSVKKEETPKITTKKKPMSKYLVLAASLLIVVTLIGIVYERMGTGNRSNGSTAKVVSKPTIPGVEPGAKQPVSGKLLSLAIYTDPVGAKLYLDGQEGGVTPLLLRLPEGKARQVEIRSENYSSWQARISPRPGMERELKVTLMPEDVSVLQIND